MSKALSTKNLNNLIIYMMRIASCSEVDLVRMNRARGGTVHEVALTSSNGNNQLVSYDYIVLYRNITNPIIIAPADYVT